MSPSRVRCRMLFHPTSRTIPWSRSSRPPRTSTAGGRWLQHHLHHLPAYRALPLLDQEQSDERGAGPEPFVEIPAELAADGIKGNDKVKVTSARSEYIAKALVTRRIKPMMIDGKKMYQIGIPIH